MGIIEKIVKVTDFPLNTYYQEEFNKTTIVLHHTVSSGSADGVISWWKQDGVHVGVCIVIDINGIPYQCFSSKYWAYSLGLKNKYLQSLGLPLDTGEKLERAVIGIELCNWGWLHKTDNGFINAYNKPVNVPIVEYPNKFKGEQFYQAYSLAQLETVRELLIYWNQKYNIPLNYNSDMWDVNVDALRGKPGVWTHVSFRPDKSDCHPQKELIEMLQSLI
jgi:hypothetical protein